MEPQSAVPRAASVALKNIRHEILGVDIDAVSLAEACERCEAAVVERRSLLVGVVNAAKLVKLQTDPILRESVVCSDLVLADGMAVVWASRLLGRPLPGRVAGIDLFLKLLALANERRHSVYLLGATDEVLAAVMSHIRNRFPRVTLAGCRNGYFDEGEEETVAEAIRLAKPDLLFIGMSTPKKELFLARFGRKMDVPVCHGVGGSFDVVAGKVNRAPEVWQRYGMEWAYRVVQEPRRMWKRYLVTNTFFIYLVLRELIRARRGG